MACKEYGLCMVCLIERIITFVCSFSLSEPLSISYSFITFNELGADSQIYNHRTAPQTLYSNPSPQSSLHLPPADPSPAFGSSGNSQQDNSSYYEPETTPLGPVHDEFHTPPSVTQAPPPPPQQPPPPPKSMFDFVSPFDALASSSVTSPRKPVPPLSHSVDTASVNEEWLPSTTDSKRKSVENLIEQLTRTQPSSSQLPPPSYELPTPSATDDLVSPEQVQARAQPRPLPPKPYQASSPRNSPPKPSAPAQQRKGPPEQSAGPLAGSPIPPAFTAHAPSPREKESSPGPRRSWNRTRGEPKGKSLSSPK